MNLTVYEDLRVKLKDSEKRDKYLDLARVLKNTWLMKVTVILIVIGALSRVTKGLIKEPEEYKQEDEWRPSKLKYC